MKHYTSVERNVLAASLLAGVTAFSSPIYAATQSFSDPTLGGAATFTTSTNHVTLTRSDTHANPKSLAQFFSDISFQVSGGLALAIPTDFTAPNTHFIGFTDGKSTYTISTGTSNPWTSSSSNGGYLFSGLNGGNQTRTLIIGPITNPNYCTTGPNGGKCPDGIANYNFNPFIDGTFSTTFTVAIAGATDASTISNVAWSYGTAREAVIPIPAAVWLCASGVLGLIGIARRRQDGGSTHRR